MFLNGRNLIYFFAENHDIMKVLTDKLHEESLNQHIYLFDFDGNFPFDNILRKKKKMAIKLMIKYMCEHQNICLYSSVFENNVVPLHEINID